MAGISYERSTVPVRSDLERAHRHVWRHIATPGTWLDGVQRVAVAAEARRARRCALCRRRKEALSPYTIAGDHEALEDLPEDWIEVIHRIATDPGRLTKQWYEKMLGAGIADTEYVEIVGVIAHITAVDTFTRGIGIELHPLPEPQPGVPSRYRPTEARQHDAWTPNIAWDRHGPNEADFFVGPGSNIQRAMTLVPDEARSFFRLAEHQYLGMNQIGDVKGTYRAISRPQIELIAARVSALNRCTY